MRADTELALKDFLASLDVTVKKLERERNTAIFKFLAFCAGQDDPVWRVAFLRALAEKTEDLMLSCGCRTCARCKASADAIAQARATIETAGRAPP